MHLIHNEQVKLRATAMNNFGVASLITGFAVPLLNLASNGARRA